MFYFTSEKSMLMHKDYRSKQLNVKFYLYHSNFIEMQIILMHLPIISIQ